jgi:hypothetical protein
VLPQQPKHSAQAGGLKGLLFGGLLPLAALARTRSLGLVVRLPLCGGWVKLLVVAAVTAMVVTPKAHNGRDHFSGGLGLTVPPCRRLRS